jgi:hypothetical protein
MEVTQEAADKIIEEIKDINSRAINHMRTAGMEQVKLVKEHYEEKIQDLNRQNDGLLGAIGRLQAEREEAVKKLEELKAKEHERDQHFRMKAFEMEKHLEEDLRQRAEETDGYKREIAELKAKLKKQTKK